MRAATAPTGCSDSGKKKVLAGNPPVTHGCQGGLASEDDILTNDNPFATPIFMSHSTRTETIERSARPWGWYETVSEVAGNKIKRIGVNPGQQLSLQRHRQRKEHWLVVQGTAHVTLGEQSFDLGVGEHCDIAVGQTHRISNRTQSPVEIVEIQFGSYLGEDDIERLQDDYGRT